jgi:hypothetical protein
MKIFLATFSLVTLALLTEPTGRAQFAPGPNPIAATVTAPQTLHSGAGVVSSTTQRRKHLHRHQQHRGHTYRRDLCQSPRWLDYNNQGQ